MDYKNLVEHALKNRVFDDFFKATRAENIAWTQEQDRIDFSLYNEKTERVLLWAEAKQKECNIYTMLTQLVLTIKKPVMNKLVTPPSFIGCFDSQGMAFVPFSAIVGLFSMNDFNWAVTPSNHKETEFIKAEEKVIAIIGDNITLFNFEHEKDALKAYIKQNIFKGNIEQTKLPVDKNNFVSVYQRWLVEVKASIGVNWDLVQKKGLMDADFYLADLLSTNNETIKDSLYVLLKSDHYVLDRKLDTDGLWIDKKAKFIDQKAHTQFWAKYDRPPKEEFHQYILERRDLLLPFDVRERKGSFFTPKIWVEKSQQYLTTALGENWQDEYTIWDCTAGTGNLLVGLTNPRNIFASTLDQADVDSMKQSIADGTSILFSDHLFKFDFLNDTFEQLPKALKAIVDDDEKRKKLLIYINPPYAEATSATTVGGKGQHKAGVATSNMQSHYLPIIGKATNEVFTQFLARIKGQLDGCTIGEFSTLKTLQSNNFEQFRAWFKARLRSVFIIPADTFDNVSGKFPIGFKIWDSKQEEVFTSIEADIYNKDDKPCGTKMLKATASARSINKWIKQFDLSILDVIGFLPSFAPDFQQNNYLHISIKGVDGRPNLAITTSSLIPSSIYYAVRKVIPATWINDRDQFLWPTDGWQTDLDFQTNSLTYTLFNTNIKSSHGTNYWIPFTEHQLGINQTSFESNFMVNFMAGKLGFKSSEFSELEIESHSLVPTEPLVFTDEAEAVFKAGLTLWQYYHATAKDSANYNVNAALYDIKAHFQGRNATGRMNSKSTNQHYNALLATLRGTLKVLAKKIEPKIYQYGFL